MSKKLIAVASAAALALSALVGIAPASAAISVSYDIDGGDNSATTYSSSSAATSGSATIDVPANNALEYTATSGRNSLMKVTVTSVTAGTVVSAVATGAKIVDEPTDDDNDYTSANGSTTFTKTATTTSVDFYVFATSTANASIAVSKSGNTEVVWFKANAGPAYKLSVTLPSVVGTTAPTSNNVFASIVDVFGNNVSSGSGITEAATSGATLTALTWDSTDKRYEAKLHNATAGPFAVTASITDPADVDGLGAEVISFFGTVNSVDAAAQVVTLTAQVAALKADYNALAKKWNAKVKKKKNKVALK